MGQVFYDMGFLASAEVVECSASDMIGQFVGHTGPKTQKLMERALGKVLFIDKAYRLGEGRFASEAIDELVDCLTKPKYLNKVVTILAGYDEDINRLMSTNPGLTSRFPEAITFDNLSSRQCLQLLVKTLENKAVDCDVLQDPRSKIKVVAVDTFSDLSALPSWGNGRDIEKLGKDMYGMLLQSEESSSNHLILTPEIVEDALLAMVNERKHRASVIGSTRTDITPPAAASADGSMQPSPPSLLTDAASKLSLDEKATDKQEENAKAEPEMAAAEEPGRDSGVPDEIWAQLQKDKDAAERIAREDEDFIAQKEAALQEAIAKVQAQEARGDADRTQTPTQTQDQASVEAEEDEEERCDCEDEQFALERARQYRDQIRAELEAERKRQREKKERERRAQEKLREMGVCVAGFQWIRQQDGYRCEGGSHFVGKGELGVN